MRIAIDARMYGNEQCSGIGTYIEELTKNLFEIDKENFYYLFLREPMFSRFVEPNERVKKIKVEARWYSYAEQIVLPWQFAKYQFDLIHYPHFNSPVLFRRKSVCTIHDVTPFYFPGHKMGSKSRRMAHSLVFRSTINKAAKVIAVSEATKRGILDFFTTDEHKIKVVYEGVDEHFKIITDSGIISQTKEKFGITKPYIFYIGVWRSHKNVEGLIKAFNHLKKELGFTGQLVLGGREDLHYTDIRQEINHSPFKEDIITTGFIPDEELPKLYSGAECLVIPSFIEGFGLIGIEAQKCNCPVASANSSCLPEIFGDSVLFFDPNKTTEMAERINQILTEERVKESLKQKGQLNWKRFNWRTCAEETLKIYKMAIK